MIILENAILKYNDDFKLGPVNLRLKLGEFISVVGPSGSGKSTLIKLITGHNKLTSGNISYEDCTRDDIMYIPQIGTTFNHLSVKENLCLKYNYSDEEIVQALIQVGLNTSFLEKFPFELSGGERQRIDLLRALLSKSKYVVLDESMSALDSKNKHGISNLLKSFVNKELMTIIYITHDVDQAIQYSTRIINVDAGNILYDGATSLFPMEKDGK